MLGLQVRQQDRGKRGILISTDDVIGVHADVDVVDVHLIHEGADARRSPPLDFREGPTGPGLVLILG